MTKHINPLTIQIIKQRIGTMTRPFKLKYDFGEDFEVKNRYVRQTANLEFRVHYHDDVTEWLEKFELAQYINSASSDAKVYTVTFTRAADAAHFKLVWC